MVIELTNRFPRGGLTELATADPELWAKESYEIATKIGYQNGALRGTPERETERVPSSDRRGGAAERLC
jgi:hypothetical protein